MLQHNPWKLSGEAFDINKLVRDTNSIRVSSRGLRSVQLPLVFCLTDSGRLTSQLTKLLGSLYIACYPSEVIVTEQSKELSAGEQLHDKNLP